MITNKNNSLPIIVNLYGAPGSGKSTGAAYIFASLKMMGVNAELVTEYAKDKVWEETREVFNNQAYIFGKPLFITRVKCLAKSLIILSQRLIHIINPILSAT